MKPAVANECLQALRELQPSSPKRSSTPDSAAWYGYYAGYADNFVADIVAALPDGAEMVLDPWNGSGTTTAVATAASLSSRGFDLNPAAIVIAKARLLQSDVAGSIASLTEEILSSSDSWDSPSTPDLTETWLSPKSAAIIRSLERRIFQLLVNADDDSRAIDSIEKISALAALFYLGLFRTIRTLLSPFLGSNPTWIRRNVDSRNRIRPKRESIHEDFRSTMKVLATLVENSTQDYAETSCPYSIEVASSTDLPLADSSVDAVITSPPYCTRIDYVVATLPELAVLGLRANELKRMRDGMIGTPTVASSELTADCLGSTATGKKLIRKISAHDSKASKGYYRKFFLRYLTGMNESIAEVARVVKAGAPAIFVVQDSFYKEIHIDLASIIAELAEAHGLSTVANQNFEVTARRNYATINPRSKVYRDSTPAIESVLIMAGE